MNIDEIKNQLERRYPDINFTEFSNGLFSDKENYWTITSIGKNKIDTEITTLFFWFVSTDFSEFKELFDIFLFVSSCIENKQYYFGEIGFCLIDNLKNVQNYFSFKFPSSYILRPYCILEENKDIWGYGIPGKTIAISPKYQEVREFALGLAAVKLNNKWGFIDVFGNLSIPVIYDEVIDFCEDERRQDSTEITFEFKTEWSASLFKKTQLSTQQHFAPVNLNNKWGFVNRQGEITVPIVYDEVHSFLYGYALVKSNKKWGFIDRLGKISVDLEFDDINGMYEWFTPIKYGDKWGYVTRSGKGYIYSFYDYAFPFKGDVAVVQANGKWGYIDTKNHPIEELKEMSKHFTYNTKEEAANAVEVILTKRSAL